MSIKQVFFYLFGQMFILYLMVFSVVCFISSRNILLVLFVCSVIRCIQLSAMVPRFHRQWKFHTALHSTLMHPIRSVQVMMRSPLADSVVNCAVIYCCLNV